MESLVANEHTEREESEYYKLLAKALYHKKFYKIQKYADFSISSLTDIFDFQCKFENLKSVEGHFGVRHHTCLIKIYTLLCHNKVVQAAN